jgi:flagellar export protein FliJ
MSGRIGSVLRLRRLLERRALGELAASQRKLREAERALAARKEAYRRRPRAAATVTPLQLRALELQGVALVDEVEGARDAHAGASAERDALRSAWSHAAVQRESVERLAQRRLDAAVAAAEAVRARALEELVTLRHGGNR